MSDFYFSVWVRYDEGLAAASGTKSNIFKCGAPMRKTSLLELSLSKQSSQSLDIMSAQASVLSTQIATISKIQSDMKGWNHIALLIDTSRMLSVSLNSNQQATVSAGLGSVLNSITMFSTECMIGGGDIDGLSMRHLIMAYGLKTSINSYSSRYARALPVPLDPFVLSYYPFESLDETQQGGSTNTITSRVGNFKFDKRNEPEFVCRCSGDSDEDNANYPRVGAQVGFQEIPQVPFPPLTSFKAKISFLVNIKMLGSAAVDIMTHKGLWRVGFTNKQQIYVQVIGQNDFIKIDATENGFQLQKKELVWLNTWINYTMEFNREQIQVTIDDLTTKTPLTLTKRFSSSLNLEYLYSQTASQSGSFAIGQSGASSDFALGKMTYSLNDIVVFDFKLSQDQFMQTSPYAEINRKNYLTRTIVGYFMSNNIKLATTDQGIYFDQMTGPCNMSDPRFAFDGLVCRDLKQQLALNQKKSENTRLEAFIKSSNGMFTFETWMKFQGFSSIDQQAATLLSSYDTSDNLQSSITLTKSPAFNAHTISCDPNPNRVPGIQEPVTLLSSIQLNTWTHFACVSNSDLAQLTAVLFNPSSGYPAFQKTQNGSYMNSLIDQMPSRTIFGNKIDGSQPYRGMIKEVRFWKVPRTVQELEDYRYQTIPINSQLRDQMLVYAMLSGTAGNQRIELEQVQQTNSLHIYEATIASDLNKNINYPTKAISPINWVQDSGLTLCPSDTVLSTASGCCVKALFFGQISKTISTGNDGITYVVLNLTISQNYSEPQTATKFGHYKHEWFIADVLNYPVGLDRAAHISTIQQHIGAQVQTVDRQLKISQDLFNLNATYIFKARVRSMLRSVDQWQEVTITVKPDCPQIRLTPKISNFTPLVIYSSMDPSLLNLQLQVYDACSDPQIQQLDIGWSVSTPSSFTISSDKRSLKFKEFPLSVSQIQVTAKLSYRKLNDSLGIVDFVSDSVTIKFVGKPFSLVLNDIPSRIDFTKSDLIFNASQSNTLVNFPLDPASRSIQYSLECPSYLFSSTDQQNKLCTVNSLTGYRQFPIRETPFVNYQTYLFTFTMISPVLNYKEQKTIQVSFFSPSQYYCPSISFNKYTDYSKQDAGNFLIRPYVYLDCLVDLTTQEVQKYNLFNIQWQVEGYSDASQFLEINNNNGNGLGLTAVVRKGQAQFQPYFNKMITLTAQLSNGTFLTAKTRFSIKRSELVPKLINSHPNGNVPFNETMMIDASQSYDPDYPGVQLQKNWTYSGGKQSTQEKLTLTPIDRLDMNMKIIGPQNPQNIELNMTNTQQPDKYSYQSLYMTFDNHQNSRQSIFPKSCQITVPNSQDQYNFNKVNSTDLWLVASIDTNQCFTGNQMIKMDARWYLYQPDAIVGKFVSNYAQTNQVQVKGDLIANLSVGASVNIDFIYLVSFLHQVGGDMHYDYVVKSIKINRVLSPIIVVFKGITNPESQIIEVGQESSYTLDVSSSYDLDGLSTPSQFSYIWECPQQMTCDSLSSTLTITRKMRIDRGLNNIDSVIRVGVSIYSPLKRSQIRYVTLKVVNQDYSKCLQARIEGSTDNVISISRDQQYPIFMKLVPIYICANVTIQELIWFADKGVQSFWKLKNDNFDLQIANPANLPSGNSVINMTTIVSYTVFGQSQTSKKDLYFNFQIRIEGSQIVPEIQTNLPAVNVYSMMSGPLVLNATLSYDPDNPLKQVVCQWTCPSQVINRLACGSLGCGLVLQPQDLRIQSSKFEIAAFTVVIQTLDSQKTLVKAVPITLVASQVSSQLPLCTIKNVLGKETFDIDERMIFYPKCSPANPGAVYDQPLNFEWNVSPPVDGLSLNAYRLNFEPYQLYFKLRDKSAGKLTISLRVFQTSSATANSDATEYQVTRTFEIPQLFDQVPDFPNIALEASPVLVTTIVNNVTFRVQNHDLLDNQYYRLRVLKTQDQTEILISKFTGSSISGGVYLPRDTIYVFLDIIEDQRVGSNDYVIYSVRCKKIEIYEATSMTKQQFNYQILPRIQFQPYIDYSDRSEVLRQLDNLQNLKNIISAISQDNQPRYNSLFFPQVLAFFNQTVVRTNALLNGVALFSRTPILSEIMSIVTQMYVETCSNAQYKVDFTNYLTLISNYLLDVQSLSEIQDVTTEAESKNNYIRSLNMLAKSSCLSESQRSDFASLSDKIFFGAILEGEFTPYTRPQDSQVSLNVYKISDLDKTSNNIIAFSHSDNSVKVRFKSKEIPSQANFISTWVTNNLDVNGMSNLRYDQAYLASQKFVKANLHDENFKLIGADGNPNFKVDLYFSLQPQVLQTINQMNATTKNSLRCISRQDNETSFNLSGEAKDDYQLTTDITQLIYSGTIKCTSKHLTTFGVSTTFFIVSQPVTPSKNATQGPKQEEQEDEDEIMLIKVPLLSYLLPALYAVIFLVLAVFGLIMNQMEFIRPGRFYNKLSLTENLQKYSYTRLLGALILQFNPICNYIIKPNYYLTRPVRLILLSNYFLIISSANLLYYRWMYGGIRLADIFWFGFALQVVILICRPKLQDIFFSLFYPKSIISWKGTKSYRIRKRPQSGRRRVRHTEEGEPGGQLTNQDDANVLGTSPKRKKKTLFDEDLEEEDSKKKPKYLEDSMRLQNSVDRLVEHPQRESSAKLMNQHDETSDKVTFDHVHEEQDDQDSNSRGDEVVQRRKKIQSQNRTRQNKMNQQNTPTLNSHRSSKDHQNVSSSQTGPLEDGKMRKLLNKFIKREQNAHVQEEVEMTDMTTTNLQKGTDNGQFKSSQSTEKEESEHFAVEIPHQLHQQRQPKGKQAFNYSSHERNQRNILEGSLGSNDQSEESNQQRDFSGFNFEPVSSQINPQQVTFYHPREDNDDSPDNNNQVHIDLESRDISQMEFDTSKDDLNNEEQSSDRKPNQEDDSEEYEYEYEHHFEGGDHEDDVEEIKYEDDDSASPTPLRNVAKIQHDGHNFTLNPKCQDDDVDVGFQDHSPKKHKIPQGKNKAPIVVHNDESFQSSSESTPSLETIYKNYRELKQLKTSQLKKILGCTLFVLLGSGLLFLHFLLMSDLTESQFSNWISCTLFSFTVMIFGTDTALYALVSWALKRTNGKIDRRICCSLINLFVYLPLGKWKYQELEIELAKLKDFDQEYGLLAYA